MRALVIAVLAIVGLAGPAFGQGQNKEAIQGTVKSVTPTSIVVQHPGGEKTIIVTPDTKVFHGTAGAPLSTLQPGHDVSVGYYNYYNPATAHTITIKPKP
jgi:hypothetical protein